MDPLAAVIGLIAHGGWGGAVVEVMTALSIVALGLAVWIGNRRDRGDEEP